jgi:hypothetical protein
MCWLCSIVCIGFDDDCGRMYASGATGIACIEAASKCNLFWDHARVGFLLVQAGLVVGRWPASVSVVAAANGCCKSLKLSRWQLHAVGSMHCCSRKPLRVALRLAYYAAACAHCSIACFSSHGAFSCHRCAHVCGEFRPVAFGIGSMHSVRCCCCPQCVDSDPDTQSVSMKMDTACLLVRSVAGSCIMLHHRFYVCSKRLRLGHVL